MSHSSIETRLAAIGASAYVTADEVLFLRNSVFADGIASPAELYAIFSLAERAPEGDPEWFQFFAEVVADFYLREEEPQGYMTDEEFQSLKSQITRDGGPVNRLQLALLVKLMEVATQTPEEMSDFTAEQFRIAITGKETPFVSKEETALIKRYLFAHGGAGNIAVTKEEAELLFDLNDAAAEDKNDPAWNELFVTGVINHLMAHLGYQAISREEAFRRDAWVKDHSVSVGRFFSRMASSIFGVAADHDSSVYAAYSKRGDMDAEEAAKVTPAEASWLADRLNHDGDIKASEKELLTHIRSLEKDLPETLKTLVSDAA